MRMWLIALAAINIALSGLTWAIALKVSSMLNQAKSILFLVYDWLEELERESKDAE